MNIPETRETALDELCRRNPAVDLAAVARAKTLIATLARMNAQPMPRITRPFARRNPVQPRPLTFSAGKQALRLDQAE